jgi:hypothetical protein
MTHLHTRLLSAATLSAAMAFGAAAMSADSPKEGTDSITYSDFSTNKAYPVGKERLLPAFDNNGLSVGTGVLDRMTWHCFGVGDLANGMVQWNGYCVATDATGDQIGVDIGSDGKHAADAKTWNFWGKLTTGTRKYAGIGGAYMGVSNSSGLGPSAEGTVHNYATIQGSYKLP